MSTEEAPALALLFWLPGLMAPVPGLVLAPETDVLGEVNGDPLGDLCTGIFLKAVKVLIKEPLGDDKSLELFLEELLNDGFDGTAGIGSLGSGN